MCVCVRSRRHSLLLYEDRELYGDGERLANLPSLGSLVGRAKRPCPLIGNKTTIHFVTAVVRLLIELGRLHRSVVTKVRSLVIAVCLLHVLFHAPKNIAPLLIAP